LQHDVCSCCSQALKQSIEGQQAATKEEASKSRGRKKGRIRELEEIRSELVEKELVLLGKEKELLDKDQTVQVLREEVRGFDSPHRPQLQCYEGGSIAVLPAFTPLVVLRHAAAHMVLGGVPPRLLWQSHSRSPPGPHPQSAALRADAACRLSAQLALERKVQQLLTEEKDMAVQEAELAIRLCTGASMPP
jgi:hypothetical protein